MQNNDTQIIIEHDRTKEQNEKIDRNLLKKIKKQIKDSNNWSDDKKYNIDDLIVQNKNELEVLIAYRQLIIRNEEKIKNDHLKKTLRKIKKLK